MFAHLLTLTVAAPPHIKSLRVHAPLAWCATLDAWTPASSAAALSSDIASLSSSGAASAHAASMSAASSAATNGALVLNIGGDESGGHLPVDRAAWTRAAAALASHSASQRHVSDGGNHRHQTLANTRTVFHFFDKGKW
jgi:hypothetical protein